MTVETGKTWKNIKTGTDPTRTGQTVIHLTPPTMPVHACKLRKYLLKTSEQNWMRLSVRHASGARFQGILFISAYRWSKTQNIQTPSFETLRNKIWSSKTMQNHKHDFGVTVTCLHDNDYLYYLQHPPASTLKRPRVTCLFVHQFSCQRTEPLILQCHNFCLRFLREMDDSNDIQHEN